MRALVTGVAGFVGSHLAERIVADGGRVRGIDHFSDYYARARKEENLARLRTLEGFELIEADLMVADLPAALDGVDAVFHLAAQPGVRGSWGQQFEVYARNNILATQRLLEALREHPTPTVYASSSSVYGVPQRLPVTEDDLPRPISPYGVTKLAAEHLTSLYARAYGVGVTAVRYFTVYGPRQRPDMAFTRFIEAALRGESIEVFGTGGQTRDFTYVDDAVDATLRALEAPPGRVYNVGGGTRTSLAEVIEILEDVAGLPVKVEHKDSAPGDPPHTAADCSRARRELGWEPRTSLNDGLAAHLRWARSRE